MEASVQWFVSAGNGAPEPGAVMELHTACAQAVGACVRVEVAARRVRNQVHVACRN